MKKIILFALVFSLLPFLLHAEADPGTYKMVVTGFDWGPAVHKLILSPDQKIENPNASDFEVFVNRSTDEGGIPETQRSGKRDVIFTYSSDENGNRQADGAHLTLVLEVNPTQPLGSPIQYMRVGDRGGNFWINYDLTIMHLKSGQIWNEESDRIMPLVDEFDLSPKFNYQDKMTLSYATFKPETEMSELPLIIWLHGGGEGGSDPTIPLLGNRAANYASEEIQVHFGGAHVIVPQAPTFWMQAEDGSYTRGDEEDIYHEALFALVEEYVAANPDIDKDRIYVGGCSNGGYMSLKLILEHPDYFAAGYISALAYHNEFVSDEQIKSIKNVPIWFVHSADDGTTKPDETVVPIYNRLIEAGAKNVHFSYYDHVTDITGFYGGEDYHYPGHWSWIYSHANTARTDFDGSPVKLDGKPVTIMEWLAAQKR
ncbi:prolyl oligopeptidase family serine peptidase [Algoriphagus hitonicola]|uniref:Prolyl oligopeptidase family protein n=1 Tax=Algoriphagus hitonicola TaxID=435880 RepID=A0A1I2PCA8_9BACT|nr:prolyl oligopeptidase family serine peptidase [Algoriphagus hitonicola]SFG13748.1 Prolyl oligopeptidase family protein [Algoriphagus hitonicola]